MLTDSAWLRVYHYDFINTVGILTNLMALVVAFIPEGMPIAVAMTLSLIAKRLRDARVLPKSLSTVETLGCVSVICSDKTGTLTENRMSVVSVGSVDAQHRADSVPDSPAIHELRKAMVLCNDAAFDVVEGDEKVPLETAKVIGNATDAALLRYTAPYAADISAAYARVYDLPFNSKNKFALTFVNGRKGVS